MAIFHMHGQTIKRSQGKSAVAAAAYRAGEKLFDERLGETFDYSKKKGVSHSEIMAPANAPDWAKDRAQLWNAAENAEIRKDAQVAREILIALPSELTQEQQVELLRIYCQENFVSRGMVVDANIHHAGGQNPHAHIMCTMRHLDETGFGYKNRDWNRSALMYEWRKSLADITNTLFLQPLGFDCTIDHRSLQAREIDLEPNEKLNPGIYQKGMQGKADHYEQYHESVETMRRNGERIKDNPDIAIKKIAQQHAVFSEHEMAKIANRCSADAAQFRDVLSAIKEAPSLVKLGKNEYQQAVFSSKENIQIEKALIQTAHRLNIEKRHGVSDKKVTQHLHRLANPSAGSGPINLRPGQEKALKYIMQPGNLKSIVGFAGTGKSFLMGIARDLWTQNGYQVKGCALAGKAAEGLQAEANIPSRTIDSYLLSWGNGREGLTKNDILVIDESGMLNTKKLNDVLSHAKDAGAKVVMIGDDQQLQAIDAGAPFRAIRERVGCVTLDEIVRQYDPADKEKTAEMRQASLELETDKTAQAIKRYAKLGAIHQSKTQQEAIKSLVANWRSDHIAHPDKTQIMMGYTRADVRELNAMARQVRIDAGEIEPGPEFDICKGYDGCTAKQAFAKGDRVYFLRNEEGIGVKNGTLGTIEDIKGNEFVVHLDGKEARQAVFDISRYNTIDLGYAATVHKSQGVTVDSAYLLTSRLFDKFLSCVGMTRHRQNLQIYKADTEFKDFKDFLQCMSTDRTKEMAIDYAENRHIEPNFDHYNSRLTHKSDAQLAQDGKLLDSLNRVSQIKHTFANAWEKIKGIVGAVLNLENGQRAISILTESGDSKLVDYNVAVASLQDKPVEIMADEKNQPTSCEIKRDDSHTLVDILGRDKASDLSRQHPGSERESNQSSPSLANDKLDIVNHELAGHAKDDDMDLERSL